MNCNEGLLEGSTAFLLNGEEALSGKRQWRRSRADAMAIGEAPPDVSSEKEMIEEEKVVKAEAMRWAETWALWAYSVYIFEPVYTKNWISTFRVGSLVSILIDCKNRFFVQLIQPQ
ncbi:unnamed protein product [Microthlaspi erraticum]|uniref:Uncharacterized protein n=1 Tax=Microthlaspi erraticum TaxID=1685480 RepID=A0A6D2KQ29_9BRAS|nr:unnamed protein product [Microthlaspi erraticum]